MPFGLRDDDWRSLLRGLVRGEYHLLLGAGGSVDSHDTEGRHLPTGVGLARELVEEFDIPTDPEWVSLARAFEAAKQRRSDRGETLSEYLSRRFTGCTPAAWYEYVCTTRWSAIWNLNIDDVLVQAYRAAGDRAEQALTALTWQDLFSRPNPDRDEVQAVSLHGAAFRLDSSGLEGLVFAIVEYLRAAEQRHAWHKIFADEFQTEPFIVVGARLVDEVDLGEILRRGNRSHDLSARPSVVVLSEIDQLQREEFDDWGLHAVETSAETFFDRLATDLREYEAEFAALTPGSRQELSRHAVRFLSQFRPVRPRSARATPEYHDFYAGHEPIWDDILANRDARFDVVNSATAFVRQRLQGSEMQTVSAIFGSPFSGKSTALLRVARELLRKDVDVFVWEGEDRLDLPATRWWLTNSPGSLLLFDGLADPSPDIADLAEECRRGGIRLVVLGAERTSRRNRLYSNFSPQVLDRDGLFNQGALSDSDIRALVTVLTSARRLGRISGLSRRQQEDYFRRDSGRQLIEGMARLEGGRGFLDRLAKQYGAIRDPALRRVYGAACLSYVFDYPVPLGILSATAGISIDALVTACGHEGELAEVIYLDGSRARPRHRRLASIVVGSVLSRSERYDLSLALTRNLAPYVTRRTISQRTLPYRIAREMMNHRVLADWFGQDDVDKWYAELQDVHGWNARYWEQRALASARVNLFDRAESFAHHAVELYRDAFTLTTLGSVLMRKASSWAEPGSESSRDYFWRGVEALREAADMGQGRLELPFLRFFERTLEIARQADSAWLRDDPEVRHEWNQWHAGARELEVFRHAELDEELTVLNNAWMRTIVEASDNEEVGPSSA